MEAWLRGPVAGVPPLLMPVAHALVQAVEEVERAVAPLGTDALWARPNGVASAGFHLRHIAGVVDRLFTYARGEALTEAQLAALRAEGEVGDPPAAPDHLLDELRDTVARALEQLRGTAADTLLEQREVGRKKIPSNVVGLLFHAAEHAQRHAGQLLVTVRWVHDSAADA
jgi:uncharacterized damage-inducible protein DinB